LVDDFFDLDHEDSKKCLHFEERLRVPPLELMNDIVDCNVHDSKNHENAHCRELESIFYFLALLGKLE
jgi:hypothetical protein